MTAPTILTENKAPTYGSSADPRVDFFFHITEDAQKDRTIQLLKKSWRCHPLDTLKLMAYLRDCRDGKGIRNQYHMCLQYLFDRHFETLMANVQQLVSYGYWKDPLHLLMVLLFDLIPDYLAKDDGNKRVVSRKSNNQFPLYDRLVLRNLRKERQKKRKLVLKAKKEALVSEDKTVNISETELKDMSNLTIDDMLQTVPTRTVALIMDRKEFARNRYNTDQKYRKLYDKIVEMFAKQLIIDLEKMAKGVKSISLAGKWCPTNGHHFDKYLFISESIGKEICRLMKRDDIMGDSKLVTDFYQKEVCTPLRKYLKIPEVYMASNQWSDIDYNRVASKCMQKNKSAFIKHDKDRFEEYLASKTTFAGAVLKPVEMVDRGMKLIHMGFNDLEDDSEETNDNNDGNENNDRNIKLEIEVLEKQWQSLCENIKKKGGGLFDNAIAVCDVSGSMNGTPMSAAIGLTILTMYLSRQPWDSICITFHESPAFHLVDTELSFIDKLRSLSEMSWGGSTDLYKVFNLILSKAVEQRLTNDQLPKMLIIFTDMEFNQAFAGNNLTNFEVAKQQFESKGYKLPPIVFWNLRASASTPVQSNELGAALISGYSGQQLQLLLKNTDLEKITPYSMMRSAIDDKRYSCLKIID